MTTKRLLQNINMDKNSRINFPLFSALSLTIATLFPWSAQANPSAENIKAPMAEVFKENNLSFYYLQKPSLFDGKAYLDLTPSNCFWTKGVALGYGELGSVDDDIQNFQQHRIPPTVKELQRLEKNPTDHRAYGFFIRRELEYLGAWPKSGVLGTIRWYLWLEKPGTFNATVSYKILAGDKPSPFKISFSKFDPDHPNKKQREQVQSFQLSSSSFDKKSEQQEKSLSFKAETTGLHVIKIHFQDSPFPENLQIHRIRLSSGNSTIKNAKICRARRRPSAEHQGFQPVEGGTEADVWIFESRPRIGAAGYCPMTTPFGYCGVGSLGHADKKPPVASNTSFNFSFWVMKVNGEFPPPPAQTPQIIATRYPDAKISFFGHEGAGIKLRNVITHPHGAQSVIQALRVKQDQGDGMVTYFAYVYDENEQRWRLAGAGKSPSKRKGQPTYLNRAGSFLEVPGGLGREHTGDEMRKISRRGWFHGVDGTLYKAKMTSDNPRKINAYKKAVESGAGYAVENRKSYYEDDYVRSGWMSLQTGGIRHTPLYLSRNEEALEIEAKPDRLPVYLQKKKLKQLFEIPVTFGLPTANKITENSATITYPIKSTGPNASGILFYGPIDCATFSPETYDKQGVPGGGNQILQTIWDSSRNWESLKHVDVIKIGDNHIDLKGLQPGKEYFYRLYVQHDEGKSWDYQSGSFTTKSPASSPSPPVPSK